MTKKRREIESEREGRGEGGEERERMGGEGNREGCREDKKVTRSKGHTEVR